MKPRADVKSLPGKCWPDEIFDFYLAPIWIDPDPRLKVKVRVSIAYPVEIEKAGGDVLNRGGRSHSDGVLRRDCAASRDTADRSVHPIGLFTEQGHYRSSRSGDWSYVLICHDDRLFGHHDLVGIVVFT